MSEVLTNGLVVTLSNGGSAINSVTTSFTVAYASGGSGSIPALTAGQTMRFFWDGEIIIVTANSGTGNVNWTATRGAESSTAISHADTSSLYQILSSGGLQQYLTDHGTTYGTTASLPTTIPPQNARYKCTDTPFEYISTGSAWQAFFGGVPVTPPVSANYSWQNQNSSTVTTNYGGEYLVVNSAGFCGRVKSYPGVNFTQTYGFASGQLFMIQLWNATPQLVDFRGLTTAIGVDYWTSPNSPSGSSQVQSPVTIGPFGPLIFLRIQDNGTNRIFTYSFDNITYNQILSESRTAHITPTLLGYGGQGAGTNPVWVVHDSYTTP